MTMLEERVSRLEGSYEHLANKADLEKLRGELVTEIVKNPGELEIARGDLEAKIETTRGDLVSEI